MLMQMQMQNLIVFCVMRCASAPNWQPPHLMPLFLLSTPTATVATRAFRILLQERIRASLHYLSIGMRKGLIKNMAYAVCQ